MKFRITYTDLRPVRIVTGEHFARSIIGRWTSAADVGDSTTRYRSAGYRKIERIA